MISSPKQGINWLIDRLRNDQSSNGSWNYPFESGLTTDIYMIVLLRTLEINEEKLIKGLTDRIISMQEKNGAWRLFYDEGGGNLSLTVEAYYALLYSGMYKKDDQQLQAAKNFILANGGIEETSMFTKTMLALTGQYKWPEFSPIPIEIILLPLTYPINFYQFSVYGRSNLAPIIILFDKKFSKKTNKSPNLSDLYRERNNDDHWFRSLEWGSLFSTLKNGVENLSGLPENNHALAIERTKNYMLNHIEPDGTLYSYFSSTFLMIFSLLSLGYSKNDPVIMKAVDGLKSMKTNINDLPHIQYTTASVWNTSLISFSLQCAGISPTDSMVKNANQYLLEHQHDKFGDWVIHNPNNLPGGWGFSTVNTMNPDIDDTTASLRALARDVTSDALNQKVWERGVNWLFSMQNDDGGWAGFEKNTNNRQLALLPIEKGEFLLIDPSCADITGRTLEFIGNYTTSLPKNNPATERAIEWLFKNQEKDGSWYGRWGICYIYGTWAAVTGLKAIGVSPNQPTLQKGMKWLVDIQNEDGGWGESCSSDIQKRYIPLKVSTITHTSWALDALIAISSKPTKEIQKGISYLLTSLQKNDWTTNYPKGQGMAGGFYTHYHSYRYVFPLLALSHFQKKFGD